MSASEHKSPERVSEEAGAAGASEVLLSGLLAVLELLLETAGAILARLPLARGAAHPETRRVRLDKILLIEKLGIVHQLHGVVLDVLQGPHVRLGSSFDRCRGFCKGEKSGGANLVIRF